MLAKRVKLDHESLHNSSMTPERSGPGTSMIDDVFATPTTTQTSNENPFFRNILPVVHMDEETGNEQNSLLRSSITEEKEEEKENSTLCNIAILHSNEQFSQYDLTPDALGRAETTCL